MCGVKRHLLELPLECCISVVSVHQYTDSVIFTARYYASAVLAMALCPSVCPSQVGVLLKQLNVGSCKQDHTIAQGL